MSILGIGHDLVNIDDFAAQLALPGTSMRELFSVRELRQASSRARLKGDTESSHLAVRWAGKESVIKAWCAALGTRAYPYTVERVPWSGIEIVDDERGCPRVSLRADVRARLEQSLLGNPERELCWHVSLTHESVLASAFVVLESV